MIYLAKAFRKLREEKRAMKSDRSRTPIRRTVGFRVVGTNLPGLKYGRSAGALVDREPVYVGMQRKREVVGLVPGDAPRAVFDFAVDVISGPGEGLDFRGPFVHGEKGSRFVYLSWGGLGADGGFTMFRRAKLHLSAIAPRELARLLDSEAPVVEGSLDLTDDGGGPICGGAASEKLRWQVHGGPQSPKSGHGADDSIV
jgi:uncharacterized protein DUF5990